MGLNAKYTRPLNDKVLVKPAEIEVFDLLKQSEIDAEIRANFENSFFIGQNFIESDFMRKCHIDGVYRVNSNFKDRLVNDNQIIKINKLILKLEGAKL